MNEQWKKSSYSSGEGNCVEVATRPDRQLSVRDSKDPYGPRLTFTLGMWQAFTRRASEGRN